MEMVDMLGLGSNALRVQLPPQARELFCIALFTTRAGIWLRVALVGSFFWVGAVLWGDCL